MRIVLRCKLMFVAVTLVACRGGDYTAPRDARTALAAESLTTDASPAFSDWSTPVNLGPVVNSVFTDSDPFISKDGLSLYFVAGFNRGGQGGRDIWVSRRASETGAWGAPMNLGATINTASHEQRPTLSLDGHRLYFASDRAGGLGGFDLYVSRRHDKRDDFGWETPVNLGGPINSSGNEQGALTMYEDEATNALVVYFTSDRPGGAGGLDIYRSTLLDDGTFSSAVLVEELSTPFMDQDPAIRRDGLEMFFASDRPGTQGALDLWVATRPSTSAAWSMPVSLGAAINTPTRPAGLEQANDMRPSLSRDGMTLYWVSAFREGNQGTMFDIWSATRHKVR